MKQAKECFTRLGYRDTTYEMGVASMLHGARRLASINAGVAPGEKCLIVCDTSGENPDIALALMQAVHELEGEPTVCMMDPRTAHGENPTAPIAAAMLAADVVFAPTRFSLSHSHAREQANQQGTRFISLPDYNSRMLQPGGALDADFQAIHKTVLRLQQMLDKVNEITVTTPNGTEIFLSTTGRNGNEVSGVCREPGTWGSPPNIEVNISPIENLSYGTIVVDGSVPMPQIGLIPENKPIVLTIEGGRIAHFGEGAHAQMLRTLLDGDSHPENAVLAEFGIGLNDCATLCGAMLDDEGAYGTAHFGFGHNYDQGGQNKAAKHIDCVFKNPTVRFDGVVVMQNGQLCLE